MSLKEDALKMHLDNQGKIAVNSKVKVVDTRDLSLAYSPGVAEPCRKIFANKEDIYRYTARGNLVAVVSTGTAVLGLGDIGAEASLPVMEGKAVLFKNFAGIDAFPLCIGTKEVDRVVEFVKLLEPTFAGINLEDIAAPECFEIEERLKEETEMAIFHDDQHGTAVVALAGLINALKIVGKEIGEMKVVVNGAGAGGMATAKLLLTLGFDDIIVCDSRGIIYPGRKENMNSYKEELAKETNKDNLKGDLAKAMEGADVFMGLSLADLVSQEMVRSMASDPIIFAMANPDPEIVPDAAKAAGAKVVGTGRSDYANQVNNVLAFPGILRGALDVRSTDITEKMKVAAAYAIADLIPEDEVTPEYVIPNAFNRDVAPGVAAAVARTAMEEGIARIERDPDEIAENTKKLVNEIYQE